MVTRDLRAVQLTIGEHSLGARFTYDGPVTEERVEIVREVETLVIADMEEFVDVNFEAVSAPMPEPVSCDPGSVFAYQRSEPEIEPPIYVRADDGLVVFDTAADLVTYVEVPDIEAGLYGPAFDSVGRELAIELPDPLFDPPRGRVGRLLPGLTQTFGSPTVRVIDQVPQPARLERMIVEELTARGASVDAESFEGLSRVARERWTVRSRPASRPD